MHGPWFKARLAIQSGRNSTTQFDKKEEAQLSQKDRSTLRVIEYFAKSLKIIQNYTVCVGRV